jgi:hypothetical protein
MFFTASLIFWLISRDGLHVHTVTGVNEEVIYSQTVCVIKVFKVPKVKQKGFDVSGKRRSLKLLRL